VARLETLGYLALAHEGRPEFGFFAELKFVVSAGRDSSSRQDAPCDENHPRRLTAWRTELEAIEAVGREIQGKLPLWPTPGLHS
jgi:hypothetical protein